MNILQNIFTDYYEEILYTLHPRKTEMENIDKMINCGLLPTPRNLQNAFDSICKKAGIPHYGIHAMRHTFATNLLSHAKNQREVKAVAEIMGEDVDILIKTYLHTEEDGKHDLVNLIA